MSLPGESKVVNFGCRLNIYESESIKQLLTENKSQNIIVFNTCTVTTEAEKKSRQAIRKARRDNKDARIVVTGCAAQVNPQKFADMTEVDLVLGNEYKSDKKIYQQIEIYLDKASQDVGQKIITSDIATVKDISLPSISHFEDRTRAYIGVQNGCDHACTFCIIPSGRGKSRSASLSQVLTEADNLVKHGYNEIVLSGVDLTAYGLDLKPVIRLGTLCKLILKNIPKLSRLRLSSIDVAEIDEDLLDLMANEKRFMPHLHLSLQSGDNMILKRMKRRHNREMVLKFCEDIRKLRPDAAFGSDIIAGFPTETEEMFQNTVDLLDEADIVYNHCFTYSPHGSTPSSRMPQVPFNVRKERTNILISRNASRMEKFLKRLIGTSQTIIIERGGVGRCENFAPVKLSEEILKATKPGDIITCAIIDSDAKTLYI